MKKTIRYFLLIMIITGALFTYGCFNDDLFKSDTDTEVETTETADDNDGDAEEVGEESEEGEVGEEDDDDDADDVSAEAKINAVVPGVVVEEMVVENEAVVPGVVVEEMVVEEEAIAPEDEVVAPAEEPTEEAAPAEPVSIYQDGVFSADGNYFSPAGPESISISLTLEADVVTSLTITPHATEDESVEFQSAVRDNAPALVVGKKLDEIGAFSKISTSSLTPSALNKAIASIKASAKN